MVLHAEKSWSSLILVPASGEASSVSASQSRVHVSGDSGIGTYLFYYKCNFEFKGLCVNNGWWRSNLVTIFWFSDVKSLEITLIFYLERIDADQFNSRELKSRA